MGRIRGADDRRIDGRARVDVTRDIGMDGIWEKLVIGRNCLGREVGSVETVEIPETTVAVKQTQKVIIMKMRDRRSKSR